MEMATIKITREELTESRILRFFREMMRWFQMEIQLILWQLKARAIPMASITKVSLSNSTWKGATLNMTGSHSMWPSLSLGLSINLSVVSLGTEEKIKAPLWWLSWNLQNGWSQNTVITVRHTRSPWRCQTFKEVLMLFGKQMLMLTHITTTSPESAKWKVSTRWKDSQKENSKFSMLTIIRELLVLKGLRTGLTPIKSMSSTEMYKKLTETFWVFSDTVRSEKPRSLSELILPVIKISKRSQSLAQRLSFASWLTMISNKEGSTLTTFNNNTDKKELKLTTSQSLMTWLLNTPTVFSEAPSNSTS